MKTKYFFSNSVKAAFAVMTTVVMTMGMTACSDDDEYLVDDEMTRGGGAAPVSYVERSWDGTKVVSTVKSPTASPNCMPYPSEIVFNEFLKSRRASRNALPDGVLRV